MTAALQNRLAQIKSEAAGVALLEADLAVMLTEVAPYLGVVLSLALYMVPIPAVYVASTTGHLGQLNPLPYAMMVVSTTSPG